MKLSTDEDFFTPSVLGMEVTDIIFNREGGWSSKLEKALTKSRLALLNQIQEKIQMMIMEEQEAKPADDLEKTAEWHKISGLNEVNKFIESLKGDK